MYEVTYPRNKREVPAFCSTVLAAALRDLSPSRPSSRPFLRVSSCLTRARLRQLRSAAAVIAAGLDAAPSSGV